MSANLGHYPPNPEYGCGTFRRRIAFSIGDREVQVWLLDDFHDMNVTLSVEEGVVVDVVAHMNRFPKSTCPGATMALAALRGTPASIGNTAFAPAERGGQCTHLADLAKLGLAWLARSETIEVIEVSLSDRDDDRRQQVVVEVDGRSALTWSLQDEIIQAPEEHCGRSLFGGFARWVNDTFPDAEADLWRIGQMAVFVARGRAYIVDGPEPRLVSEEPARRGACFSFSGNAFNTAIDNIGYVRDMSGGLPPLPKPGKMPTRKEHDERDRHNR